MSLEEAEVLKERANAFLRNAHRLVEEGEFDLAAFSLEQCCQLMLKYKLLVRTGAYPHVSSLMRLIRDLAKVNPSLKELLEGEDAVLHLTKLEDAYIAARYLPRRCEEVEVRAMLRFVEEVFKPLVERV